MRLLRIDRDDRITFTEDLLENIPPYAILSHTWGTDQEECVFDDIQNGPGKSKSGYSKILFCGQQARRDGLEYFWVDSVCINKANHAELSEAINSMYKWYRGAQKCYVYLTDVSSHKRNVEGDNRQPWESAFRSSRWFTRGWTLQELLAPESVEFFSREEELLGSKKSLHELVREITGIPPAALQGTSLSSFSVAERMKWAAKRNTKRVEDKVYCLLGIFDVFMSPIYGEGEHASVRLKDAIARSYRSQLDSVGSFPENSTANGLSLSKAEQRAELLASLRFEQMDSRRTTIKKAHTSTCQWLITHSLYSSWIDKEQFHDHHGFLWINGKPGAGKSTLIKYAHAHAEKSKAKDEIILSFFFNARGEELERSTLGMYRALLSQLLVEEVGLQEILDDYSPRSQKLTPDGAWSIDTLRELLSLCIVRLAERSLKCFIDALDECNEEEVRDMIWFWEELGQVAIENGIQVRVCFSSRHYPTIDIRHSCKLTLEDEAGHSEDLVKYVKSHLRTGTGTYIEEIRASVVEKANGVFMWAVLVVDILNKEFSRGRMFAVKKRLAEVPPKLSDLFKDMLRRDCSNMDDMLLCIQWILFAKRPLKREEFYFAMVSGLNAEPEDIGVWDPKRLTTGDMDRFVLNSSKGLAELTRGKQPTVQFIHESVKDFLIKEDGLRELWPEIGENFYSLSHDKLKISCWNYLKVNGPRHWPTHAAHSQATKDLRQRLNTTVPFLEYACWNFLYHANEAATQPAQGIFPDEFDVQLLLKAIDIFERYEIRRHGSDANLAYMLAENNLARLLQTMDRNGWDVWVQGGRYQLPIFTALIRGHQDTVTVLLDSGSTTGKLWQTSSKNSVWNIPEKDTIRLLRMLENQQEMIRETFWARVEYTITRKDKDHQAILRLASQEGLVRVITSLQKVHKIDINMRDKDGRTTLAYAAAAGQEAVVQLLLKHGALPVIDRANGMDMIPLIWAARKGHVTIVRHLLDDGRTPYLGAEQICTPFLSAAEEGQIAVMQLLLERGADIDHQDDRTGMNALLWALSRKKSAAVCWLLRSGIQLSARSKAGSTALFYLTDSILDTSSSPTDDAHSKDTAESLSATQLDLESFVNQVLQAGVGVDETDQEGRTALINAAMNSQCRVARILLEKGADAQIADKLMRTALSHACQNGNASIVELLLRNSANIEAEDLCRPILIDAIMCRRLEIVRILLEYPVNLEATNEHGVTALRMAALMGHFGSEVVRMLLAKGAAVDAKDRHGRTALSLSMQSFVGVETVQHLIDTGANINLADNDGWTPLMWAASFSAGLELIRLILVNGAQVNVEDNNGWTALMRAVERGLHDEVALLREYGATR